MMLLFNFGSMLLLILRSSSMLQTIGAVNFEQRPSHYYSCIENFAVNGTRLPFTFCNPNATLDSRLDDLLGRLSIWEKTKVLRVEGYEVPTLGLPKLGSHENTHGVKSNCGRKNSHHNNTGCATSYPSGTGLGAAFDRELWREVGAAIGTEVRGFHNQPNYAMVQGHFVPGLHNVDISLYSLDPNINLMRDPRWGRAQEVPGEDPFLTSEFAVNLVEGMQFGSKDGDNDTLVSAVSVKHFSLYDFEGYIPRIDEGPLPSGYCDTPAQGCQRWNSDSTPPLADFVDYFLEPFRQVITRAQPTAIMCSYNAVYGKPTCADNKINNKLVRDQWGFQGFFVSDCTALELMQNVRWENCPYPLPSDGGSCIPEPFRGGHNYTHSVDDTIRASLVEGGIDLNCGPLYNTNLYSSYLKGAVSSADIDRAARRIFRIMILLGMLDPQQEQKLVTDIGPNDIDSEIHRHLALRAAQKSLVLLKNQNQLLPLAPNTSVAFIGPHANSSQSMLSNYFGDNILVNEWTPYMAALKSNHFSKVSYALGAHICDYDYGQNPGFPNMPCDRAEGRNLTLINEAIKKAQQADVVVMFLGSDQTTEAENFDRNSLDLPGNGSQQALIDAITKVNPNIVVVLIHGGPMAFDHSKVPAILDAFFPGELGGKAIVDAITGEYNPGGKLPYTNYLSSYTENRDIRDTDLSAGTGITHMYYNGTVMFPFGYGLSYTEFEYSWVNNHATTNLDFDESGTIIFSVRVKNVGSRAGDVVCLAFLRNPSCSLSKRSLRFPRAKLFAFDRVFLNPGETKDLQISLHINQVAFIDQETAERVLPSGTSWTVEVGDVVNPLQRRYMVSLENAGERVLEKNEIVLQRYLEWANNVEASVQ